MPIPEAAVPPFAPTIEEEYEQARESIRTALDELYRSCQILAAQATDTDGFATDDDIDNLQTQIDNLDVTVTSVATASSLEAPAHKRSTDGSNVVIPDNQSLIIASPYEVEAGDTLEIGLGSTLVVL